MLEHSSLWIGRGLSFIKKRQIARYGIAGEVITSDVLYSAKWHHLRPHEGCTIVELSRGVSHFSFNGSYLSLGSWMTTCLGKSCSFGLPRVPFVNCLSNVFSCFPFGFERKIWDLIVSVPDHCLSYNSLTDYWIWRSTEFPSFTLKFQYSPCYVIISKQSGKGSCQYYVIPEREKWNIY